MTTVDSKDFDGFREGDKPINGSYCLPRVLCLREVEIEPECQEIAF